MSAVTDLDHLITGLRSGAIEPFELARLAREWRPADGPFLAFVTAHKGTAEFAPEEGQQPTPPDEFRLGALADSTVDGPPAGGRHRVGGRGGRYTITAAHRAGGLGAVWRAWDPVLGREVAVKTVRPDRRPTDSQLARFVREARTTGRLEHPCIVPVYDLVDADPAGPCYVMRFVSGRTLAEAAAEYHRGRDQGTAGPLDLAALLDAFAAVCRAVAFAHAKGVLHRDLKGQNVVLGEFGEVFLVDWGLAKATADAPAAGPAVSPEAAEDPGPETAHGSVVGTPSFMAPEVARGEATGRASDVYGLGAMLYQLLTGRPPYDGPDPRAVANAVAAGEPPAVRAANPAAPAALAAVCEKAMSRDPAARYPTADALALDVKRWLAGEPVSAYPEPLAARAGRWANRHKPWVAAGLAVLLTVVAGLGASTALLAEEQKKTAAARAQAEDNLRAAHGLTVGLIEATEQLLPAVPGADLTRRALTRHARDTFARLADQRPDDPAVADWAARLHLYDANLRRLTGDAAGADAGYREALARYRAGPPRPLWVAVALRETAVLRRQTGRPEAAIGLLTEAAAEAAQAAADDPDAPGPPQVAATVALERAAAEADRGRWAEALAAADDALDRLGRLPTAAADGAHPYDPLLRAAALTTKGVALREQGRAADADTAFQTAEKHLDGLRRGGHGVHADDINFARANTAFERTAGWLRRPDPPTAAVVVNFGNVVRQCDNLAARHPDVPMYRAAAARARAARGERLAAGTPAGKLGLLRWAVARADQAAARAALTKLAADHPAFPGYRADLARLPAGR